MENRFEEVYKSLNPGQREAVDTIEGPVMVVAGPGTGKTQVLTVRIANILKNTQVNPENILALTFTESAAQNMRVRLADLIGTPAYKVEIATFHGFANKIIRDFPEEFPGLVGAEPVTELEQIEILEKIVMSEVLSLLRPFGDQLYYVRAMMGEINNLKKEGVTPEVFKEAVEKQQQRFGEISDLYNEKGAYKGQMKSKYVDLERSINKNAELAVVFEKYQEELKIRRFYDFSDMLIEVLAVMELKSGLLSGLQERYQYILVDEHQDTNSAQNKIIELMASFFAPNPNLFVVGDEKQAIFRFQGATIENFLYFKSLYPGARLINLTDNYRSSQRILDGAGSLIRQNVTVDVMVEKASFLKAKAAHPDQKIGVVALSEEWMEGFWVAREIEKLVAQGIAAEEIAVIVRQNRDFDPITQALANKGIRFRVSNNQDILTDKWINQLLTIFRAVDAYHFDPSVNSDLLITKCLHFEVFGIDAMTIYKLLKERSKRRISLIELLENKEISKLEIKDLEKVLLMVNQLKVWVGVASNETLDTLFINIFNESGIRERVLQLPNSLEELTKFKDLFDDLKQQLNRKKGVSLREYLEYLDLLGSHNLGINNVSSSYGTGAVQLLTAHKAKGLEFDGVFITQAVDGHWGNSRKRSGVFKLPWEELGVKIAVEVEVDEIEDERRLFYVALTRARKRVWISYPKLNSEGREQLPCQFVSEIEDSHKEQVDVLEFEKEIAAHPEVVLESSVPILGEDKKYLQELFKEQGLSATSLGNYLECPWKYFYRNLLQLPDVKNKYMIFGSAIHTAINRYILSIKENERLSLEELQQIAMNYLERESLTKRDYQDLVMKCSRALNVFYEERMKDWDSTRESELRIRGVKLSDDVVINGVIDMIEPFDPPAGGLRVNQSSTVRVRVTDFKSGRVKSRAEMSKEDGHYNYQQQLTFYKLLLDSYQYKKMVVGQGVIDFVEPDGKGKLHREVFAISEEDKEDLKKLVLGVADEILNLKFWDRYCDEEECEYCFMRKLVIKNKELRIKNKELRIKN